MPLLELRNRYEQLRPLLIPAILLIELYEKIPHKLIIQILDF